MDREQFWEFLNRTELKEQMDTIWKTFGIVGGVIIVVGICTWVCVKAQNEDK